MIMTVDELRQFITTDKTDQELLLMLQALERSIQGKTQNNFRKYMVDGEIQYPADIKLGVVRLIEWDLTMREKSGIQSESISRHSVTYQAMSGQSADMGYPAHMTAFLRPYMRAVFG